jgi:hypothetical protein
VKVKLIEVRDKGTFIPMMAVQLQPEKEADRFLLARAGFGRTSSAQREYITLVRINGGTGLSTCDPHDWNDGTRTLMVAHNYIIENWEKIDSGDVVDVEFILGETKMPKESEATETRI